MTITTDALKPHQRSCSHGPVKTSCANCKLNELCLPLALDMQDIEKVDQIIQRGLPMHAGDFLYHAGDPFQAVYAVRSGSLKTCLANEKCAEQVTGFFLPGEVLGFDGVGTHVHRCSVVALETSTVCEIPFERLEELARHLPLLQRHFFQLMGNQISSNHQMMLTLSRKNAEGRISTLLFSLSTRHARRNLSPNAMRLPMSRMDIGNFLGLSIETVSRTFSRMHKEGVLEVQGREVLIRDHARLNEMAHSHG